MNINKKKISELLWRANPHLSDAEVAKCMEELRKSLLDVDDLMMTWDANKMRSVVSLVNGLIKELRTIMDEKEAFHFFSAVGGGVGALVGLFSITNPLGRLLLLGGGFLMSAGFGIGAAGVSEQKNRKLLQIKKLIEEDRMNFRVMAMAICRLDGVYQRYLKFSVLSEENQKFLESAVSYQTAGKKYPNGEKNNNTVRIHLLLRKIATAESLNKIRILIDKQMATCALSTFNPLLAFSVQTLLLIIEVNDNETTMDKLFKNVAAIYRQCEIVEGLYVNN